MHSGSGGPAVSDKENLSCNMSNGLANACGEAAWGEGKARQASVRANGISKSLPPLVRPHMPTLYFMHFKAMFFTLLLSFQLFIYLYFFRRMPYVEHDRLAEESGASRSVLKDIRVLILMWTDRSLSCCEPKDHGSWKTRWRSRHPYYRSQKVPIFPKAATRV